MEGAGGGACSASAAWCTELSEAPMGEGVGGKDIVGVVLPSCHCNLKTIHYTARPPTIIHPYADIHTHYGCINLSEACAGPLLPSHRANLHTGYITKHTHTHLYVTHSMQPSSCWYPIIHMHTLTHICWFGTVSWSSPHWTSCQEGGGGWGGVGAWEQGVGWGEGDFHREWRGLCST